MLLENDPLVLLRKVIVPQRWSEKSRARAGLLLGLLLACVLLPRTARAEERSPDNIRWTGGAILFDGIDRKEKYSIPVKEAVDFISAHSRFKVLFFSRLTDSVHGFTYYDCPAGLQTCVSVNKRDVEQSVWDAMPTRDFYMLLWEAGVHPPLQAGGTWGVAGGVPKSGLNRPYITIPVDPWWYNNEPFEGFNSRAAQILTHEIINALNAKLEVAPYYCSPLIADPGITFAADYEASRLSKLTDDCYQKYVDNTPADYRRH